jgi:DNA-binding response OmpR family regulator
MSIFDFFRKKNDEPSPVRRETPNERRVKPRKNARPGTRILIIDDSKTVCAVLSKMLRENGYITYEALDAETGLKMMETSVPDLVFLDIVLPGMSGFEALRKMRRNPTTANVPIIMISGNESATEQFYVQRIGANDFMKKPFSRAEVFSRLERVLNLTPTVLKVPGTSDVVR